MKANPCVALIAACVMAPAFAQPPTYEVTHTVPLGAPDRWDYVVFDPDSHRVYVAHGDRVTVVDGISGSIIGQVEGYPGGTHGVAVVSSLGRGFTDDGEAGEAGEFDLATLKTSKRIKTAMDADGMVFDPVSGHVFVVNGDSGTVSVIDPKLEQAVATVHAGEKLETPVAGRDGKVYVNGAGNRDILRIDTRSNRIDARWPVPDCESPHGIAIDPQARRLFASCVNKVLVAVNLDSGAVVATVPIGAGTDAAGFDPRRKRIFSSNGRDGTLSIIEEKDPQTFVLLATIDTAISARTMTLNPETGRLYLVAADVYAKAAAAGAKRAFIAGSLKLLFLDPTP